MANRAATPGFQNQIANSEINEAGEHQQAASVLKVPAISPGSLDCLLFQFGQSAEQAIDVVVLDDNTAQKLMERFAAKGHLTLAGRSDYDSLLKTDIIPMCASSTPLRHASIAYQASLDEQTALLAPVYMQSALSHYLNDLEVPERLQLDSTLAAGVLLCSVSINCMYIWTPLLTGLYGVLQHRGLLANGAVSHATPVALHLFEVIALMDITCFTINRRGKPLGLWKQYLSLAGSSSPEIEQTSGLPYNLITILADLDAPDAEQRLQNWAGVVTGELVEVHLWDTFRHAGILHSRALRQIGHGPKGTPDMSADLAVLSTPFGPSPSAKVLRLRALACIQAIMDSGAFAFREPLFRGLLYPLYIIGVLSEGVAERRVIRAAFNHLDEPGQQTAVSRLVLKSWENFAHAPNDAAKLAHATSLAAADKVEIHLT